MKSILIFIVLIPLLSFSQNGPGGVGSTDGSSSLVLWLNANTVSGTNGSVITSWTDDSGNGYDFTVGNGAVYNTNTVNGYPAFNFNGSSQYFERAYTSAITPDTFTIFSSTKVTSSGKYKAVISNRDDPSGSATAGFILYSRPSNNKWQFWTGRSSGSWQITSGGTSTHGSWAGQVMEYQNTTNGKQLYINGTLDASNSHTMTSNPNRPCRIGAGRNETTPDYYFYGDIAEVIMFDEVLNSAQQIIINNYLAAKYNYTLSSNDIYDEDNSGNGNYDHDVAGIGRIDNSNIHNDAQGTGIIRINNPSDLNDDEFLIWGHDNGILQATNTTDIPSSIAARLDRVWRVSERNSNNSADVNVGTIDMSWDLTGLGNVTASDLRLLIDTDNDGTFSDETPISGATSLGGNIYQFSNINALANNLRFTLGTINKSQTPLPIELIKFKITNINNTSIKIEWATMSEINNDYFTIERSLHGINWEITDRINGAGNSSSLLTYSSLDNSPYNGLSYYRLKQTDFNGTYSYSAIKSISIQHSSKAIKIYPNPTNSKITITGDRTELTHIEIYNILGMNVTMQTSLQANSEEKIIIDLSHLTNGIYYIKTKTTTHKISKQ